MNIEIKFCLEKYKYLSNILGISSYISLKINVYWEPFSQSIRPCIIRPVPFHYMFLRTPLFNTYGLK